MERLDERTAARAEAGAGLSMNLDMDRPDARSAAAAPAAPTYEFGSEVVCLTQANAPEVEAIRTVRTHLMARHLEDGRRGLAVCAATPNVGCTFSAVNLAVSLSQAGISTVLIDGDLRKPRLEAFIRPEKRPVGLKQMLSADDWHPTSYVHAEVLPNLSIVYSGGAADDAQELLAGERFRRFIDSCLRDFEFTIIDTPPINSCSDALRISKIVGYTLIVARTNVSRTRDLGNLASQLREDGAKIIGTILCDR